MKRVGMSMIAALLVLLLLLSLTGCGGKEQATVQPEEAPAVQQEAEVPDAGKTLDPVSSVAALLQEASPSPTVNSVGGEWLILGLSRSEADVPEAYYEQYYKNVEAYVAQCGGVLHERKYSEYSRVVLALTAIGKDPTNVGGFNLVAPLSDYDQTCFQGINGPIFALIALDSGAYELPTAPEGKTQATRELYVELLLEKELPTGGWCLTGDHMETDMTAMVLQALAKYQDREDVAAAVERGLAALSQAQNGDGGFDTNDGESSESVAQVIVALGELGISLEDARFVKEGRTLVDRLMDFRNADGGFCHLPGEETNQMATEQAFYALVSIQRAEQGKTSLYDMSDVG